MTTEQHAERIRAALKNAAKYRTGLEPLIESAAQSLRLLELSRGVIDDDGFAIYIDTMNGSCVEHPVCKTIRDTQQSLTRHLKLMGLSQNDLAVGEEEESPLVALTRKIAESDR